MMRKVHSSLDNVLNNHVSALSKGTCDDCSLKLVNNYLHNVLLRLLTDFGDEHTKTLVDQFRGILAGAGVDVDSIPPDWTTSSEASWLALALMWTESHQIGRPVPRHPG